MKTLAKYASVAVAFAPFLSFAEVGTLGTVTGGPTTITGVWAIIQTVMNWVIAIFFLFATYQFIRAGWAYLSSEGSEEKTTEIRKQITYGVVGVAVGLLAFSLPRIVQNFLGVSITG